MLRFENTGRQSYEVWEGEEYYRGDLFIAIDGDWVYDPELGTHSMEELREILKKLEELNADAQVREHSTR